MTEKSEKEHALKSSQSGTRIFIAGDSTAADKLPEKRPETGWGQVIGQFFRENVRICNYAKNGRSTKSFVDEGLLAAIASDIGEKDYLFIQFGHNDEKDDPIRHTDPETTYKQYLTRYIECARSRKAFPVLLTPVQRRSFDDGGKIEESHGRYPGAMRELALEEGVPLLDISEASKDFFEALGPGKTKEVLLWLKPGEHPNYPLGVQDNTHFCENGAICIAELIIKGIKSSAGLRRLAEFIKK